MARVAIVTGATGGIGAKFVEEISKFSDIDQVWATGRNLGKLEALASANSKVVVVEADLATDGVDVIDNLIRNYKPDIKMLVNNAGVAYMGKFEDMKCDQIEGFCNVNCTAPTKLISLALPYMHEGAKIINVASASSFQPNPYLTMYSATKVYLKNFSRALNMELKNRGISVTCSCPYWVDTGMLPREKDGKKINYPGMVSVDKVVNKALRDSKAGREMSVPGFFANYFRIYSKLTPTAIVMRQWITGIKKYL